MPARQEGAPHLDLAQLFELNQSCSLFLIHFPAGSSRPLLALPPPSSPRTSPSERTERGAEDGGRCSFSLSPFSLDAGFDEGVCMTARQRRGDAHGHESPRPPRTALSQQREEISMSRRGRAASEGRGRRCNRATGNRQPPFHAFLHLHTCAFSLISSACFLWQVTAPMRRREGQALRRKRPRYTKPATHGRLLAPFLAPICTPIDL